MDDYDPIEVQTSPTGDTPWYAGPLTYALKGYIDSEFSRPLNFQDPAMSQYAVTPGGQVYMRGSPVPTQAAAISPVLLLAGVAVLGLLAFVALK